MCFKAPGQHCSRFGHSFTYLGSLLSCKEQAEWLSVGDWVPEEQEQPLSVPLPYLVSAPTGSQPRPTEFKCLNYGVKLQYSVGSR